ncbi:MAG: metallophosphoesterase family protein [Candidatus Hydrothermarchaeaceae archaeon]
MKVAVISDIHANFPALEKVLEDISRMPLFCCGDLVGYNTFPNEAIDLIRTNNATSLLGNHDRAVLTGDTGWFNSEAIKAIEWTAGKLTPENRSFLKALPMTHENEFYMVHGSPKNPLEGYIFPGDPDYVFSDFFNYTNRDIIILGHTHIPFVKKIEGKLIFNPGSVGQPRDSDPRASYALLDTEKKEVKIKRVGYDIEKTSSAIMKAGLPKRLGIRLFRGI